MRRDWVAVFAGPLAWFGAHVAGWMLAPPAHASGSLVGIRVAHGVALLVALAAGLSALARTRTLRYDRSERAERDRVLVWSGVALSALSILLVLGLALPTILLVPGAEP